MTEQDEREPGTAPPFTASRARFGELVDFAGGRAAAGLEHAALEQELESRGRELLRQLFQDHLDLRADREERLTAVTDADGTGHRIVEANHDRALATVFGQVTVRRLAYRSRGTTNLYPADAALNLPAEKHSHGLRRLAAIEAARGSFQETVAAIDRGSGARVGKRQVEALTVRAAVDFNDFYDQRRPQAADQAQLLVMQVDGKGIVMRPEALRPATAKAAEQATGQTHRPTVQGRETLSQTHRRGRRGARRDTGGAHTRGRPARQPGRTRRGQARSHRHRQVADRRHHRRRGNDRGQSLRRGRPARPGPPRTWVVLVDGNNHQIDRIHAEANTRGITVHVLCDFVHVMEYLWKATWSLPPRRRPGRRGLGAR